METGDMIREQDYKIRRCKRDEVRNIIMFDMMDEDFKRLYFHYEKGYFIFEDFRLRDRVTGYSDMIPKEFSDVQKILRINKVKVSLLES